MRGVGVGGHCLVLWASVLISSFDSVQLSRLGPEVDIVTNSQNVVLECLSCIVVTRLRNCSSSSGAWTCLLRVHGSARVKMPRGPA